MNVKWKTFDTMVDRLALHIDDSNYVHNSTELVLKVFLFIRYEVRFF